MAFIGYICRCSNSGLAETLKSGAYNQETFQCVIRNYMHYLQSRNMGTLDMLKKLNYLSTFHNNQFKIDIVHSKDNLLLDCSNNVKIYLSIQAERALTGAMIKHLDIHCIQEFVQFIDKHNTMTIDQNTRNQLKASNEYIELLAPKRF